MFIFAESFIRSAGQPSSVASSLRAPRLLSISSSLSRSTIEVRQLSFWLLAAARCSSTAAMSTGGGAGAGLGVAADWDAVAAPVEAGRVEEGAGAGAGAAFAPIPSFERRVLKIDITMLLDFAARAPTVVGSMRMRPSVLLIAAQESRYLTIQSVKIAFAVVCFTAQRSGQFPTPRMHRVHVPAIRLIATALARSMTNPHTRGTTMKAFGAAPNSRLTAVMLATAVAVEPSAIPPNPAHI